MDGWRSDVQDRRDILTFVAMKTPAVLLGLLILTGEFATPAAAQLVHVSATLDDSEGILLRADNASIPWDDSRAIVTQLNFSYDLRVPIGTHDPRSFWHIKGYAPAARRSFDFARPIDFTTAFDRGLSFVYLDDAAFEDFRLTLVFDKPIAPDGRPPFPLPSLGPDLSGFSIHGGNSLYHIDHLIEAFGGGRISAITTEFIPIPESSSYAVGAVLLATGLIAARRRRARRRGELRFNAWTEAPPASLTEI